MTPPALPKTTAERAAPARAPAGRVEARGAKTRGARTKFAEVVVVCAKCAKRQGLTPHAVRGLLKGAAKEAAKGASKRAAKAAGAGGRGSGARRAKLLVVESGCLGPCPKRALAVATGASLAAGRVLLLDPAAGPEAMLSELLPGFAPAEVPAPEFGPNADLAPGRPDESPPTA